MSLDKEDAKNKMDEDPPPAHTHTDYELTSVDPSAPQQPHILLTGVKEGWSVGFYGREKKKGCFSANINSCV